jgi:hypothetical protein
MLNKIKKKYNEVTFSSKKYWENRYSSGGNSGAGSYDVKAEYKARVLNRILKDHDIKNIIEFGCGDGNNLQYYNVEYYTGFDLSETAIKICLKMFSHDFKKSFIWYDPLLFKSGGLLTEMTISFEVIFHLIEDDVFEKYLKDLFNTSSKYVLICSSNDSTINDEAIHVKHRKFTDSIPSYFSLFEIVKTPQEGDLNGFFSDFYLFKRRC